MGLNDEDRGRRSNLKLRLASYLKDEETMGSREIRKNGWRRGIETLGISMRWPLIDTDGTI